jgi:hypothetical protein
VKKKESVQPRAILLVTDECVKRLRENGSEDLDLPDGTRIRLSFVRDKGIQKTLKKYMPPDKGCYVLTDALKKALE